MLGVLQSRFWANLVGVGAWRLRPPCADRIGLVSDRVEQRGWRVSLTAAFGWSIVVDVSSRAPRSRPQSATERAVRARRSIG